MGEERRNKTRKKLEGLMEVFDINAETKIGRVVNISIDGIMLLSPKEIPINNVWQLKMDLPVKTDDIESVFFGAESLWCEPSAEPGQYWAGFHVIDIAKDDLSVIESFISG